MKPKNFLLTFVFAVVLLSRNTHCHDHHHFHQAHHEQIRPGHESNEDNNFVKRQNGGDQAPSSDESSSAPSVPTPDVNIDVGEVMVGSVSESCKGALLEPTFVLTSATCVYPNHTAEPFANISFSLGKEIKPVKRVFRNPYWFLTGKRDDNLALLQLEQPMPPVNQKNLLSMSWSSYGLEDLGDSFIADPVATSCDTASNTARKGDTIRHMDDKVITLSCSNKGKFDVGSPIYRMVNGAPVIYGVYFGHCTSGSLDRAISGSCGARISKQAFQDFCRHAMTEGVELTSCDSKLLQRTHVNFPTTVFSRETYDAKTERNHNHKAVVLAYHSSASDYYQSFVEDMETIQRLKSVYNQFEIAVVDVNILPIQIKGVPFIEYRTVSSETFIPYNDKYDFTTFRNFMDVFGKVGAPPIGTTSFLQSLHFDKRSGIPETSEAGSHDENVLLLKSGVILSSTGSKFVPDPSPCHATAGYYLVEDKKCACMPTHFGSGNNCVALPTVLQDHCTYRIGGTDNTYSKIVADAGQANWCNDVKGIRVTVTGSNPPTGLTPEFCANAIADKVECSHNNDLRIVHDKHAEGKKSYVGKRSTVNTKSASPPQSYLENFEGNTPPGPITHAPNTHYYTVKGEGGIASATPYSVLFDGNRGIPVFVGYKISNANMKAISNTKSWLRNRWTKLTESYVRIGSNKIYLDRSDKKYPEGVEEGQLNPNQMHTYADASMDLTFNHINAFPQYTDFAQGVWRKYQNKIISYAKDICSAKDVSAVFYAVSGVSDYELTGVRSSAFLRPATFWPVAYEGAVTQPDGSPELENGLAKSIIQPKSAWTVGCCAWTKAGVKNAQSVSFWANNKPRGVPKYEVQPDLSTLRKALFPGKQCFKFFPANSLCNSAENHFTMEP
ncbi:uncharacterized protein LOC114527525 [Dendronephthya gigantea]|uniref:uncharacterized protein LOC114527525 n=1 Tax=Dendronephthya gigantea TaxID=151771 RepID=UPI0010694FDA|nr:uncharacterized protein LOC114527525 [Dendronephthya gigantea]